LGEPVEAHGGHGQERRGPRVEGQDGRADLGPIGDGRQEPEGGHRVGGVGLPGPEVLDAGILEPPGEGGVAVHVVAPDADRGAQLQARHQLPARLPQDLASRRTSRKGLSLSTLGSRGSPRSRSLTMFRWISLLPPAIDMIRPLRKSMAGAVAASSSAGQAIPLRPAISMAMAARWGSWMPVRSFTSDTAAGLSWPAASPAPIRFSSWPWSQSLMWARAISWRVAPSRSRPRCSARRTR